MSASTGPQHAAAANTSGVVQLAGKHVHFVGIGGCGMSGLARMVQRNGAICSGTDLTRSTLTESLAADGMAISYEQVAEAIPADCDMLVISPAIKLEHPEVLEAKRRNIRVIKYPQMLGELMIGRRGVAVAGTHGKSSTTSMLSHVLIDCGCDPSFIVGATCKQIGGGARVGNSDILVAEACEYDRSFHNLNPTDAVILNVEEDHMEVYGTLDAIIESFRVFARKLPATGMLLINHEMTHRMSITGGLDCNVQTIGFSPQADWRVQVNRSAEAGDAQTSQRPVVQLYHQEQLVTQWRSPLPGDHMAYNAAAAAVLAHRLGAQWEQIGKAIESFEGLDRRMQRLGSRHLQGAFEGDVEVVDDYGHHPTEVDMTLRALRRHYRPKRLICVFQPHQHSRTRFLMEQFATSFSEADIVIVPHIYFVRDSEQERQAVTAGDMVDRLRKRGKQAMHLYPFDAIVEQLEVITRGGDLVVTMGAGDVWKVARDFLDAPAGD